MMRKIFIISLIIMSGVLCWSQDSTSNAILRLKHLPSDALTPELAKYVSNLMEKDDNPLNYLPIINQLDSLTALLSPYESLNSIGFSKFTSDLHMLSEAIEILDQPYNGERINNIIGSIDDLTFHSKSQVENQQVDSIFNSVKQYYGITTNLQELLNDMIDGKERYMTATTEEERTEILKEIEENLTFDLRNKRLSRIPYLKAQLDIVFKSCPRDESSKLIPESFDVERLKEIYESNERARSTRVKEDGSKDKSKKKNKQK